MPQPFARVSRNRALYPASLALCALSVAVALPARGADWPMFQGNPAHLAVSGESLAVPMALEWKFRTTYYANNPVSPVVSGKTVYLASQSTVYALDGDTGEQKWKYPAEGPIGATGAATIRATPAVADGTLFVGASDGVMYAVDAATGVLKWQFQTGGGIRFSPIVVDGVVYFGSDDTKVYGVNAKDGKESLTPVKTGNNIIGSPAYADGMLYFTSGDLNTYAVNTGTGRVRFQFRTTNGNVQSSPVVSDRYLFSVGGSKLYALLRSGNVRWEFSAQNPISNTPLVTEDGVYFGDRGGRFYALDMRGRTKWTITDNASRAMRFSDRARPRAATGPETNLLLAGAVNSSPILVGKNILVGTNRGFLYAIDPETGKINWEYGVFANLPGNAYPNITAPPVAANGRLYVMSDDGALHCFNPNALDTDKPSITGEFPIRATEMNGTPPIAMGAVVADEGSGINAASIKMTLDDNPVEFTYQPNNGRVSYRTPVTQAAPLLESGRHIITLSASDWKGNTATTTWSFVVDNTLATSVINTPTILPPPVQ